MQKFRTTIYDFWQQEGRALPWRPPALPLKRGVLDPYAVLVSEVMLQQTQVDRVIPKYEAWLKALPTWEALAGVSTARVLKLWQGLGYNRRALALAQCAEVIVAEYKGKLPRDEALLQELPGIGPYTAGAVRAFAFNEPVVIIETNIRAVFIDYFFSPQSPVKSGTVEQASQQVIDDKELLPLIEQALDRSNPREWYWALMDYGSHLKRNGVNPSRRSKQHTQQSRFEGSNRQVRGAIVRLLTKQSAIRQRELLRELAMDRDRVQTNLATLEKEGFLVQDGSLIKLASYVAAKNGRGTRN